MSISPASLLSASARVEALVQSRLRGSPYPSIQRLNCDCEDGRVVLSGRVRSFFEKQVAQESIANLDGVDQIVNGVEVVARGRPR